MAADSWPNELDEQGKASIVAVESTMSGLMCEYSGLVARDNTK